MEISIVHNKPIVKPKIILAFCWLSINFVSNLRKTNNSSKNKMDDATQIIASNPNGHSIGLYMKKIEVLKIEHRNNIIFIRILLFIA